jgi:hypothetical protein
MDYYNHSLDLPFSKTNLKFRELNTAEQLALAKANLTIDNKTEVGSFEYFNFLNETVKNCIKDYNNFLNLDIIEYTMFITKLRSISIGSSIQFLVEKKENDSVTKQKINLNLNYFLKSLYEETNNFFENKNNIISEKNILIYLKWPNIKNINLFLKNNNLYEDSIFEFIDKISINNIEIDFQKFNNNQKKELIEKFSISFKKKLESKIFEQLEKLMSKNLTGIDYFKEQKFSIYGMIFVNFLRLFLSNDIKSIYSEIYYLCSNNLNAQYVYDLSPSERKIYISIINESKSTPSEDDWTSALGNNRSLEDLAVEFNQTQK